MVTLSDCQNNQYFYIICDGKKVKWRANGKLKTWKRDPARFRLPVKHGLYSYWEITNTNAGLFYVDEGNFLS